MTELEGQRLKQIFQRVNSVNAVLTQAGLVNEGFPHGWHTPEYLTHHPLSPLVDILEKLALEGFNPSTPVCDVAIPGNAYPLSPNSHPPFYDFEFLTKCKLRFGIDKISLLNI